MFPRLKCVCSFHAVNLAGSQSLDESKSTAPTLPRATCGWNRSAGGLTPSISHHSESHFADCRRIFLDLLGQRLQCCDVRSLSLRLEIMISHSFTSSATSKQPDLLSMRARPTRHQTKYIQISHSTINSWNLQKMQGAIKVALKSVSSKPHPIQISQRSSGPVACKSNHSQNLRRSQVIIPTTCMVISEASRHIGPRKKSTASWPKGPEAAKRCPLARRKL